MCAKSLQLCPTLCDPVDCGLPGSSVHGILQARILEWVAMPFLQGIFPTQGSNSHLMHWKADSLLLSHQGNSTGTQGCHSKRQMVFAAERGQYPNTEAINFP